MTDQSAPQSPDSGHAYNAAQQTGGYQQGAPAGYIPPSYAAQPGQAATAGTQPQASYQTPTQPYPGQGRPVQGNPGQGYNGQPYSAAQRQPYAGRPYTPYQQTYSASQPPQAPYAQQPMPFAGTKLQSSGFTVALVGLILSVLAISLPGLICCIIGLVKWSKEKKDNHDIPLDRKTNVIAVIGIIIGAMGTLAWFALAGIVALALGSEDVGVIAPYVGSNLSLIVSQVHAGATALINTLAGLI